MHRVIRIFNRDTVRSLFFVCPLYSLGWCLSYIKISQCVRKLSVIFFFFFLPFTMVWTYSSDDCACHLAVLVLGGSAPRQCLIPRSSERRHGAPYFKRVERKKKIKRDILYIRNDESNFTSSRTSQFPRGKCNPPRTTICPYMQNPLGTDEYIYIHV